MLRLWATSTESSPGWLRAGMDPDIGGVRAFTRGHGCSPGQWRHDHITS